MKQQNNKIPLVILPVYKEEKWHSMDLISHKLYEFAKKDSRFETKLYQPFFIRVFSILLKQSKRALNIDRALNRYIIYPLSLIFQSRKNFYFISDHSYGHLATFLPKNNHSLFIHDLDMYEAILKTHHPSSFLWKLIVRWSLNKAKKAPLIFFLSHTIKNQTPFISPEQSLQISSPGTKQVCVSSRSTTNPYIAHVGSTIPRKNVETLLKSLPEFFEVYPDWSFFQVGGTWSKPQQELIKELGIKNKVYQYHSLSHDEVMSYIKQAAFLAYPSLKEGFGIPLIESLSQGTPVIASDLEVFREIASNKIEYNRRGTPESWTKSLMKLANCYQDINKDELKAQVQHYTWENYASSILDAIHNYLKHDEITSQKDQYPIKKVGT